MTRPHSVIGIIREGRTVAAEPGHRPKVGDHLLVAAARDHIGATVAHIAGRAPEVRDVVIVGAGRIGLPLARNLEAAGGALSLLPATNLAVSSVPSLSGCPPGSFETWSPVVGRLLGTAAFAGAALLPAGRVSDDRRELR